jgi:hypothetical protein
MGSDKRPMMGDSALDQVANLLESSPSAWRVTQLARALCLPREEVLDKVRLLVVGGKVEYRWAGWYRWRRAKG